MLRRSRRYHIGPVAFALLPLTFPQRASLLRLELRPVPFACPPPNLYASRLFVLPSGMATVYSDGILGATALRP